LLGFIGLVELMSFLTIGAAQGKRLVLFGNTIDVHATLPWVVSGGSLLVGGLWLRFEAAGFHRVWESLTAEARR
jgi:branched-chain amino acid transport system permease protein